MLLMASIIFIILSSFVGASSLKDDTKTGYFVVASIIFVLVAVISFLFIY